MIGDGGELVAGNIYSIQRALTEAFTEVMESLEY